MPQGPIPPTPLTLYQLWAFKGGKVSGFTPLPVGQYQEFYCQSGGSNLNSGTDISNTAKYTTTNGSWSQTTLQFIPSDGSNPVGNGVNVGDGVSIYIDGATVAVCTMFVTSIVNDVNGAITLSSTRFMGASPTTLGTTRTLKCGGAWKGPNAGVNWPFSSNNFQSGTDPYGNYPRVNMKNDATYSTTVQITPTGAFLTVQGYTNYPGDGGRATIDWGTLATDPLVNIPANDCILVDLIGKSSATTGSGSMWFTANQRAIFLRCTATGARGNGFSLGNSGNRIFECEAYNCNTSNTLGAGGFVNTSQCLINRCISTNNKGHGFVSLASAADHRYSYCIANGNSQSGFALGGVSLIEIIACDAYNNGESGIVITNTTGNSVFLGESCNVVNNRGAGFKTNLTTGKIYGYMYNCGFGTGTMANRAGNVINPSQIKVLGSILYPPNVTPWLDPDVTGNFSLALAQALGAGRGNFTQTQGGFSGTQGYPDVGAAQHSDSILTALLDEGTPFIGGL